MPDAGRVWRTALSKPLSAQKPLPGAGHEPKHWNFSRGHYMCMAGFGASLTGIGVSVAGGMVLLWDWTQAEYAQGMIHASYVKDYLRDVPMIPVYSKEEDLLGYLSSKSVTEQKSNKWNAKPFPKSAIQKEGELYLLKQALILAEDQYVEWNIGISPTAPWRQITSFGRFGGSGIHDQVCGEVFSQQDDDIGPRSMYEVEQEGPGGVAGRFSSGRLDQKIDEVFCGIGLGYGLGIDVEDLLVGHLTFATYGYGGPGLLNYLREAHGIEGVDDPKLTRGHQILLASLPRRPVKSFKEANDQDYEDRWKLQFESAVRLLDLLIEKEILPADPSGALRAEIIEEIKAAKPPAKNPQLSVTELSTFVQANAEFELKSHLKTLSEAEKKEWRYGLQGLVTAMNPQLQNGLEASMTKHLHHLNQRTVGTAFIVNKDGEYLALHTGTSKGYKALSGSYVRRRMQESLPPGSLGKLMVGGMMAKQGKMPNGYPAVAQDIMWSRPSLSHSAQAFADEAYLGQILACYGGEMNGSFSNFKRVVTGNWSVSAHHVASYLHAMQTGTALASPHVIVGELRDGFEPYSYSHTPEEMACANALYQGGRTAEWASLPLKGTMNALGLAVKHSAKGVEVIGKTGTKQAELGGVDIQGTTNLIWAPFSVALGGENYTVVNVFWPEDQGQNGRDVGLNLGNAVSASNGAVPLSADTFRMMDKSLF